jgi:hypothetical protein
MSSEKTGFADDAFGSKPILSDIPVIRRIGRSYLD